jgi:hypothetical protein
MVLLSKYLFRLLLFLFKKFVIFNSIYPYYFNDKLIFKINIQNKEINFLLGIDYLLSSLYELYYW